MSQKVSRKAAVNEDRDKSKAESPVKEMKKKMAANAEKEKQAVEKADKAEKSADKPTEKATEKTDKSDKADKSVDKKSEKPDKTGDKKNEKDNAEKNSDKAETQPEKNKEEISKEDKGGKSEKEKADQKKGEASKQKQNSSGRVHNGVTEVTVGNGTDDALNGTVSADSEDDDGMLVIDDHDHDELFPELKYDDTSDVECFEVPTPENGPSRSLTRRSQVKSTRTPETPRPASDKQAEGTDDAKDGKVLKLKEDVPTTDRKLRSADSPKPQEIKKQESEKKQETEKKNDTDKKQDADKKQDSDNKQEQAQESGKIDKQEKLKVPDEGQAENKDTEDKTATENNQEQKIEMEIIVDVEVNDGDEPQRKTDTNYSKSRVKVSPYRRSMRLADQTNTSMQANYTGNNTTMEMDITESSSLIEENNLDDSTYLRGLRSIRGRTSYKPLKEYTIKHVANRSVRSTTSATLPSVVEPNRPTGTVVGRKRKPDHSDPVELATEVTADIARDSVPVASGSKRMRVLERLAEPFRRVTSVSISSTHRRNADIVGINTDLPLTAPVVADTFDPETLKSTIPLPEAPIAVPLPTREDNKRCILM